MAKEGKKIFVLDTSVILYDHNAIQSFDEHDVAIPIVVLEELDNFKQGSSDKNFQTREFIRMMDALSTNVTIQDWVPLGNANTKGKFKVVMDTKSAKIDAHKIFGEKKNDHQILNVALSLMVDFPKREVVLVSKDINLRLKAKALSIKAEDFNTGKVKDIKNLASSVETILNVSKTKMEELYNPLHFKDDGAGLDPKEFKIGEIRSKYFIFKGTGQHSAIGYFNKKTGKICPIKQGKVFGVAPLNDEQTFAMHALLDSNTSLVTIKGVAGTGKTLIALASALEQKREFSQIYLARPIIPLATKDIGFLPGDIKSKINPYMEPLWDNLKFIQNQFPENGKDFKKIQDLIESEKLLITPLAYIRGRSISNVFFIVDEAQNLTPHEVKTIITRAGENTKIVFTGDIHQIDTPYLDTQSNGLSYIIDKLKNNPICAHITLEKGERSELANLANDLL